MYILSRTVIYTRFFNITKYKIISLIFIKFTCETKTLLNYKLNFIKIVSKNIYIIKQLYIKC